MTRFEKAGAGANSLIRRAILGNDKVEAKRIVELDDWNREAVDFDGRNALMTAAIFGKAWAVELLLARCDTLAFDHSGSTALTHAIEGGHAECVRLLAPWSDIHWRGLNGRTPLWLSLAKNAPHATSYLGLLTRETASSADHRAVSPLMLAVGIGSRPWVEALLAHDAQIDARDETGRTALWYAGSTGNTELCKVLLDVGADASICSDLGETPLMAAVSSGLDSAASAVQALMNADGAALFDARGRDALMLAASFGRGELCEILWSGEVEPRALMLAEACARESGFGELSMRFLARREAGELASLLNGDENRKSTECVVEKPQMRL